MDWLSSIVGSFFTSTAVTAVVTAVIQGALVGAAIGGISALVTGGSLSKGLLFGAVGGAVAGGLTEYFTGGIQNRLDAEAAASRADVNVSGDIERTRTETLEIKPVEVAGEKKDGSMIGSSFAEAYKAEKALDREALAGQQEKSLYAGIGQGVFSGLGAMYSAGKAADAAKETAAMNAATQISINETAAEDALARQRLVGKQQREQQDIGIEEAKRKQALDIQANRAMYMEPYLQKAAERERRSASLSSLTLPGTSFLSTV